MTFLLGVLRGVAAVVFVVLLYAAAYIALIIGFMVWHRMT